MDLDAHLSVTDRRKSHRSTNFKEASRHAPVCDRQVQVTGRRIQRSPMGNGNDGLFFVRK